MRASDSITTKSGKTIPLLWKPVPHLHTLDKQGFLTVLQAVKAAKDKARIIIRSGTMEERTLSVQYAVVGPYPNCKEAARTLACHVANSRMPSAAERAAFDSPSTTNAQRHRIMAKYTPPSMRIQAYVSTRYYNENTLEPQVSFSAFGGGGVSGAPPAYGPQGFASRFPGGIVPHGQIQETLGSVQAANALAAQMREEGYIDSSVTGQHLQKVLPDVMRVIAGQQQQADTGAGTGEDEIMEVD
jgi:hypothetical protein